MDKQLLLTKLESIMNYANKHYMRLLIEIDPDLEKMYIYCDDVFIAEIQRQILLYEIDDIRIKYIVTDHKMYYPENNITVLPFCKGDISLRFFRPNVGIDMEYNGKVFTYFVAINNEVDKKVRKDITDIIDKLGVKELDNLVNNFDSYINDDTYKINRIGDNRLAVYKY